MEKNQFVKDIKDKDQIASPFMVKFSALAVGKNGRPYMNLILTDRTGELEAKIWEHAEDHAGQVVKDAFVWVEGRCQLYQSRRQVVIDRIQILREDEVSAKDFIAESEFNPDVMYSRLLEYVSSMGDPYYKALAEAVLRDDPEIKEKIKKAPAAKSVHHAYRGGLLEHVVSMSAILDSLASHYGNYVDRDLMFLGCFFHDIGKLWELSYDRVTDYTTEGRLIGHLVMGVELVEKKVRELEALPGRLPGPFPEDKKLLAKHMILSHHGQLEFGSPKRPKCMEALIVHMVDDMDSKVNAIRLFIAQDQTPGLWSAFSKQYERYFYKSKLPTSQANVDGNGRELLS